MPRIAAVDVAFPPHYHRQEELAALVVALEGSEESRFDRDKVSRFFSSVGVKGRHLALPLETYRRLSGMAERNAAWTDCALSIGDTVVSSLLRKTRLSPQEIDLFVSSTVTGLAVPSLEARLMNRLQFSPSCRRLPLFGLGCVAGAAGIARVTDYLVGHPNDAAILLCVELCSLTWQKDDTSVTNIIACGLFGDGAGGVLLVGDEHPLAGNAGPGVIDTRSVLFPDTERTMGWDIVDDGFRVVLSSGVPEFAKTQLAGSIRTFLRDHGLSACDIGTWIAHPGGPAVIEAIEGGLELPHGALDRSRTCLAEIGNVSSVSVLVMLNEVLRDGGSLGDKPGLLFAMGPGFCAELVLLQ